MKGRDIVNNPHLLRVSRVFKFTLEGTPATAEEIIEWWNKYGVVDWETSDVCPILHELLLRMASLSEDDCDRVLDWIHEHKYRDD